MSLVSGFPPVTCPDAQVLILGSMPGVQSLTAQQYYAHPRNAFWQIMADLLNIDLTLPYQKRLELLNANSVALWDVLACCRRSGSLDSAIGVEELRVNNFRQFFDTHPAIRGVFFNGAKSAQLWQQHVVPTLTGKRLLLPLFRLPSTSPAYASMRYQQKLQHWSVLLEYLG